MVLIMTNMVLIMTNPEQSTDLRVSYAVPSAVDWHSGRMPPYPAYDL